MKKVLIIDDEVDIAEALSSLLSTEGYLADIAVGGKAGIRKCLDEKPEIVLIDMMMPEVDGMDVITALRKASSLDHTKLILMSASKEPEPASPALAWNYFLAKPCDIDEVIHAVRSVDNSEQPVQL